METGVIGVATWVWVFGRFIRRLGRLARRDTTHYGWLLAALTASITAYAVGMVTYDAFSFIQSTFVMFILLALGAAALARAEGEAPPGEPREVVGWRTYDRAMLTEAEVREVAAVLRSMRQPWWWRIRRRLARFVGLRLRLVVVGYLLDVDRDRFVRPGD